jgi:hypothetical protein
MTMVFTGGNQLKAEKIARDLVKDLTVEDVYTTIGGSMGDDDERRLCDALDEDYVTQENRIKQMEDQIETGLSEDARKLFDEYVELQKLNGFVRQQAYFHLGYMTALRLLCHDDKAKAKCER